MLEFTQPLSNYSIIDWIVIFGALLGYSFLIERFFLFMRQRFSLNVLLRQDYFTSQHIQGYDVTEATEIGITAHLHNKGTEDATILAVSLYTSLAELTNLPMATRIKRTPLGITTHFDDIIIRPQEEKTITLYTFKPLILPPQVKVLTARIELKTTKKTITKSLQLNRHI